jgi:hypothetical protein
MEKVFKLVHDLSSIEQMQQQSAGSPSQRENALMILRYERLSEQARTRKNATRRETPLKKTHTTLTVPSASNDALSTLPDTPVR